MFSQGKCSTFFGRLWQAACHALLQPKFGYDAYLPPPEEHGFVIGKGDVLAVVTASTHSHTQWIAFLNREIGPTLCEAGALGGGRGTRVALAIRLPITEALMWARGNKYSPATRGTDARMGFLMITADPRREDVQVIPFWRSTHVLSHNPVNDLIDAANVAVDSCILMHDSTPPS
ncbi:MAG TPA: hypothetical protein PKW35_04240 [Nannocystaceae bacterium]|nr:hypothetical protein [Nannocystaceae bacterium]